MSHILLVWNNTFLQCNTHVKTIFMQKHTALFTFSSFLKITIYKLNIKAARLWTLWTETLSMFANSSHYHQSNCTLSSLSCGHHQTSIFISPWLQSTYVIHINNASWNRAHVTLLQTDVTFHTIPAIPHSVVSHFSLDVLRNSHVHSPFMMPLTNKSPVMLDDAECWVIN